MILNPGNAASVLGGLFAGYQTRFQQAYQATELWQKRIAEQTTSLTYQEIYAWMQRVPKLRKWVGDRSMKSLASYSYQLVNQDWEDTLVMDRNVIEDDQYGIYNSRASMLGMQSAKWADYMVRDAMIAGQTSPCYDGQNFFDPNHPVNKFDPTIVVPSTGSNVQSNYVSNTPLTVDSYNAARVAMMSWVGEDGESLGVVPDLLVVPPSLEPMARLILHGDFIAPQSYAGQTMVGTNSNPLVGSAELLVLPDLATEAKPSWYLIASKWPVKPFIWQLRRAPAMVPLVSPTDPNVFRDRQYVLGVDARGAAGYGLWWLAYKAQTVA